MGPLSDGDIRYRVRLPDDDGLRLRIEPFEPTQIKRVENAMIGRAFGQIVGFGLSCYGYDVRLGRSFRWLAGKSESATKRRNMILDPLNPTGMYGEAFITDEVIIPPHDVLLAETAETIRMPEDCLAFVTCKSTWARCFLGFNITTLEPGWRGTVTLELANLTPQPIRLRAGHGIAQVVFFAGTPCLLPYNQRPDASYQDQFGPTPPRCGPDG